MVNIRHGQYDTDSRVDTTEPVLTAGADGATVDGTALMLTFQDPDEGNSADHLDEASAPADFAVTVAGSARTVSSVNVNGSTVTLTLASPVGHAHTVTAGYTPGTTKIRDRWGNEAAQIAGRSVRTDSPEPSLSIEPVTVDESDGTATFTLTLSGPSAESTTRPGTALRRRGRITQRRTAPSPLRREKRPSPSASRSPTTLSTRMARPFGNPQGRADWRFRADASGWCRALRRVARFAPPLCSCPGRLPLHRPVARLVRRAVAGARRRSAGSWRRPTSPGLRSRWLPGVMTSASDVRAFMPMPDR